MTTVQRTKISFRGLDFQLSVSTSLSSQSPFLDISLRKVGSDDHDWHGHFTHQFIEELTKKTGNFKRFSIFTEMVYSTFGQSHQGVTLELISHEDLKTFGIAKGKLDALSDVELSQFDKLYLIVTYAVAFDRVHYPLPLTRRSQVDFTTQAVEQQKLKHQLSELSRLHEESIQKMSLLMKENDRLRHELKARDTDSKKPTTTKSQHKLSDRFMDALDDVQVDLRHIHRELNAHHSNPQRTISSLRGLIQTLLREIQLEFKLPYSRPSSTSRTRIRDNSVDSLASKSSTRSRTKAASVTPLRGRSGYQVVKSQPLSVSPAAPKRQNSQSRAPAYTSTRTVASSSRQPSKTRSLKPASTSNASPFRRFDPTQYVLEQERKRDLQRQRSRSRDSFQSLRSLSRSPSVSSSRSQVRTPTQSYPKKKSAKNTKPTVPRAPQRIPEKYSFIESQSLDLGNEPPDTYPDTSASDIDARLASLHAYLQSALP